MDRAIVKKVLYIDHNRGRETEDKDKETTKIRTHQFST